MARGALRGAAEGALGAGGVARGGEVAPRGARALCTCARASGALVAHVGGMCAQRASVEHDSLNGAPTARIARRVQTWVFLCAAAALGPPASFVWRLGLSRGVVAACIPQEDVAKMTSKLDQAAAKSASLKEEVAELQNELAALAKQQAELDKIRMEESADFKTAKAWAASCRGRGGLSGGARHRLGRLL